MLLAIVALPGLALGHAELVSADPADGGTVEGPDVSIALVFSQALTEGSGADVIGPDGAVVVTLVPDSTDPTRLVPSADGTVFGAGEYAIQWTSVADDGDILRGTITFTVTAPSLTPPPTPTPAPGATPAPTPTPSPSVPPTPAPSAAPGDGPGSGSEVIVPITAALVLVSLAAWWLLRRRPSAP